MASNNKYTPGNSTFSGYKNQDSAPSYYKYDANNPNPASKYTISELTNKPSDINAKSYDPSSVYSWAQAGARAGGGDLKRYGIDFSQEEQDRIANIFRNEANAAYGAAQNQYSQDIANQQASLSDTIRRSQAEAVATGASRGMQAANELSAILGLQQAAAQGATQIQGDYAQQLASAQEQAANLQNQQNQIRTQFAEADLAAEAQKHAANMDFAANDFNRVLSEAADLRSEGRDAEADALLGSYMSANGYDQEHIDSVLNDTKNENTERTDWVPNSGVDGFISDAYVQTGQGNYTDMKWKDLDDGKNESASVTFNGTRYYLEFSGTPADSKTTSALTTLAGGTANKGACVAYQGKLYIYSGNNWYPAVTTGKGGVGADYKVGANKGSGQYGKAKDFDALTEALKGKK